MVRFRISHLSAAHDSPAHLTNTVHTRKSQYCTVASIDFCISLLTNHTIPYQAYSSKYRYILIDLYYYSIPAPWSCIPGLYSYQVQAAVLLPDGRSFEDGQFQEAPRSNSQQRCIKYDGPSTTVEVRQGQIKVVRTTWGPKGQFHN